jgi:hypothetical protein
MTAAPATLTAAAGAGESSLKREGSSVGGQQPQAEDFDRGVDWAAGAHTPLSQLVYNVYSEADYDVIWDRWAQKGGCCPTLSDTVVVLVCCLTQSLHQSARTT